MDARSRRTVLLVEDEAIIAMAQTMAIERFGYEAIHVHSGEKAVELVLANKEIDLILMDIDLGRGIDGTEAARRILAQRNRPIVFLSSHSEREMVEKVRGITRYGYVIKNSGDFVLQSSIEMAFDLFEAHDRTRSQEAELGAIYENAPIIMLLLDGDRRVHKANGNALSFAGKAREDVVGLRNGEAMRCLNALISPEGCGYGPACGKCLVRRTILSTFETGLSNDGVSVSLPFNIDGIRTKLHFLLSTKLLNVADKPLVLVSLMDITERTRAEEALKSSEHRKSVLNRIANVFLTISDERVYAEVTEVVLQEMGSALGLFGYLSETGDLVVPSLIKGIGHTNGGQKESLVISAASVKDHLWNRLLVAKETIRSDGPFRFPGNHVPISRFLGTSIVFGGKAIGLIAIANGERAYSDQDAGMLEDIAHYISPVLHARLSGDRQERERRRAEEELRLLNDELEIRVRERTVELERKNAQLQELDRLKSLFIASMSHELRTPLNSIIGFSRVLEAEWIGPVNPEQKDNLAIIHRSGKLLLNLVNNVIDVSEIETGAIEAHYGEFELFDALEECARYVEDEVRKKGLALRLRIHRRTLYSDKRRLLQCVVNLLLNAVKFTEKGEIVLSSESVQAGTSSPAVDIAVSDTGFGIAEADTGRLFKPFARLDTRIKARGAGLGLYLTKRLVVEILKGDIRCASAVGEGSSFTLSIPERIDENGR